MAQPCHLAAHPLDLLDGVGHQDHRGAAGHQLLHPLFALLLEEEVAHRQHLVGDEDVGLGDGGKWSRYSCLFPLESMPVWNRRTLAWHFES